MPDVTDRLSLPLLVAGQAQKEVTHNEALTLIDFLAQPVVVAVAPVSVPAAPTLGQSWIVGAAPTGAWAGKAAHIASWTSGGWRFCAPREGMCVWSIADTLFVRRTNSVWSIGAVTASTLSIGGQQVVGPRSLAIPNPSGGSSIDVESRLAIGAILSALRAHGLIST
jgi:Protein of unknown function (DUF2793)